MPPRRRPTFTAESIDLQLQQIHLLDPSSTSENLEQLGPIIKQIHSARHEEAYLRTLSALVESKESAVEQICRDNYHEFVSAVSTLLTVRQYTHNLQDKITTLDSSVSSVGQALLTKKKDLLKMKSVASNLDQAIDALQSCLRVLDVVNRVGDMISNGNYWSALRSLNEIQRLPPSTLSQTPFFTYLLSSVPSLRGQIKDAVTASNKSWLLEIRNISGQVGKLALDTMETRARRWRLRQEKDPLLKASSVGSAVELASNEGKEVDVLDSVDFKPLYQCLHIYSALEFLEELQKSYHADRKAQSTLILPTKVTLSLLPTLIQELAGFFIIETHVLRTTRNFRSVREVEELWEEAIRRVNEGVKDALKTESDPELFIAVKECLLGFSMTMENYGYSVHSLHVAIMTLLQPYVVLLQVYTSRTLDELVRQDELVPMKFSGVEEKAMVFNQVWLHGTDYEELMEQPIGQPAPWSSIFYLCCKEIRLFASNFYHFVEDVTQHQWDVDETLGKALDDTLTRTISEAYAQRVGTTSALSQIAQVGTNLAYFEAASEEMESSLPTIRARHKGDKVSLPTFPVSLRQTLSVTTKRINDIIESKLHDFFDLSEYDWTPKMREMQGSPSMYLYELLNWLSTVVDGLTLQKTLKDRIYATAVQYVADCLIGFLIDSTVLTINDNGLANLLVDVDFIDSQLTAVGRSQLSCVFEELRSTINIPLDNKVQDYLNPSIRSSVYANVRPKRLGLLLEKLGRYGLERGKKGEGTEREKGERRRRESESVGRIYPGEGRS